MEKVEIKDISYEGSGVGKVGGQVFFVPKSLPGEVVSVDITKQTTKYATGEIVDLIKKSEKRIEPACPYFNICGGCDFQHCEENFERELKILILRRELEKVGYKGEIAFQGAGKRLNYRNKIKFEVEDNKLGYFKNRSHEFFEVKNCPLASLKICYSLTKIREFLKENKFENLKNVYVREFEKSVGICFLFSKNAEKYQKNAKNIEILRDFDVFFAYGDVLESDKTKIVCLCGNKKNDMKSFRQVNNDVANMLYSELCERAANKFVVNAYSGQGELTALLAGRSKFVYGIEMQRSAHESAEKIKKANVKNICAKVEDVLGKLLEEHKADMIILDPARAGCQKTVLEAIRTQKIDEIAYVSCNFSTLIRDIKILSDLYFIDSVKIFDMFPMTARMETLVILKKKA